MRCIQQCVTTGHYIIYLAPHLPNRPAVLTTLVTSFLHMHVFLVPTHLHRLSDPSKDHACISPHFARQTCSPCGSSYVTGVCDVCVMCPPRPQPRLANPTQSHLSTSVCGRSSTPSAQCRPQPRRLPRA